MESNFNSNGTSIIRIEGMKKIYDLGEVKVPALAGVDINIKEGSYVAIMGPSGSGKSTLLNLLGCLDRPTAGRYFLGEQDVSLMSDSALSEVRGQRIGFIFQSYNLIPQLDVVENIHVPLFYQGKQLSAHREHCEELARLVGLGLNAVEMEKNVDLDAHVVHDVNTDSSLPFDDASFNGVVITVSQPVGTNSAASGSSKEKSRKASTRWDGRCSGR